MIQRIHKLPVKVIFLVPVMPHSCPRTSDPESVARWLCSLAVVCVIDITLLKLNWYGKLPQKLPFVCDGTISATEGDKCVWQEGDVVLFNY